MRGRTGAFLAAVLVLAAAGAPAAMPSEMSVQVRNGQLRATPSFLGKIVGPVGYGDRVSVVMQQGDWVKVTSPRGTSGWIHESALTRKRIVMKAGAEDVNAAASGDELALAGKGFNQQVENEFKAGHKDIDFTWVDRMGKITVSSADMQAFLKEGGVAPSEGGAP